MKFRTRLVAALSVTTAVTFGSAFGAVSVLVDSSEERELDDALHEAARDEVRALREVPGLELGAAAGPLGDDATPLERYVALYLGGRRASASAAFAAACADPPDLAVAHPHDVSCGAVRVRALVVAVPRRTDARLLVGVPRTNLEADALYLRRTLALALALAVGTATLVTTLLVRRLTRQHEAIAQTAHRVADGDLAARVETLSNDADVVALTRDVNHMISRVETLVTSQRRFVAHAAHELRSPLTALYGELQLASRKERSVEEYRSAIAEALNASRRLKTLTEELLVLARLGTQAQPESGDVGLRDVVDDAIAQIAQEAASKGVAVEVQAEPVVVRGRRGDLVRLVRNLIENAVAHSDPGLTVTVTVRQAGTDEAEVRVADEGSGVPEADRERIFEPFFRAAEDRERVGPGAGLGLAIAREIARTHAGELRLAPAAASGAVFVARLPRAPAPSTTEGSA